MIEGCLNPNAVNYDPAADTEDHSCIYLLKHDGECHMFRDYTAIVDKSFTLSYSIAGNSWVFFHDYIPDFYIHTREFTWPLAQNLLYKMHENRAGQYIEDTIKPYFIDVVFRQGVDMILETVNWITEFISQQAADQRFQTLTHISVWNSVQHTGRIALSTIFDRLEYTNRRTKGEWSFNDFRDLLSSSGGQFLEDIFANFALDTAQLPAAQSWYERGIMEDSWFCVRFEFDNSIDAQLIVHNTDITSSNPYR